MAQFKGETEVLKKTVSQCQLSTTYLTRTDVEIGPGVRGQRSANNSLSHSTAAAE